jgi:hypothetical protein
VIVDAANLAAVIVVVVVIDYPTTTTTTTTTMTKANLTHLQTFGALKQPRWPAAGLTVYAGLTV